jgi:hypothetical protein
VEAFNVYNFQGLVDVIIDLTGFYTGVVRPVLPSAATAARPAVATVTPEASAPASPAPTGIGVTRHTS